MKNKVELLSPAGDLERLKIALEYGADAVYIGGPLLNLRANAINFTFDEIKEAVIFAHERNKLVYVTVNIVLHQEDTTDLIDYLKHLDECHIDAIIVSDPYIIDLAHKNTNLSIHLSTQASTMNIEAAKYWKSKGVDRIVLAREVKRDDIKKIKENVDIEIETFIHGAMCAGVSGRCVMSNFLTNRDANRGGCSQICRWDFDLLDENKKTVKGKMPFTFCSKDLSMLKYIKDMIDIGITSFKIEGRMRSSYYIATVVSMYRRVIDECIQNDKYEYNKEYEKVLRRVANRDSVPQFYNNVSDYRASYYNGRQEISNQDFLGIILNYNKKTHMAIVSQRNYFKVGDDVEIFGPNHDVINYKIDKIFDEDNNIIDVVRHPKQIVKMYINGPLEKDDMIRKKWS
mgnify:CR=1 FL=1